MIAWWYATDFSGRLVIVAVLAFLFIVGVA
jgi:hypothetical protein